LVRAAVAKAQSAGADLVVASELLLSGYPPKDLLLREGFVAACDAALEELATSLACAPAVMIDGELHGRVTPERFDALIAALEPGK